jgi:hypothetical protein
MHCAFLSFTNAVVAFHTIEIATFQNSITCRTQLQNQLVLEGSLLMSGQKNKTASANAGVQYINDTSIRYKNAIFHSLSVTIG